MSLPTHVTDMSAVELARLIGTKQISPVEVIDQFLDRIEQVNPHINAFCTILAEEARSEAQKLEQQLMRSDVTLGPLGGVPVAIKDLTPVAGVRTTFGSQAYADYIPTEDAVVVKRLKAAGAIIIGKTNTPEFGHKGTTDNLLFGTTKNPWNVELTSGGSSGGSAAAVAARLVPVAEGSDGGGSIRIPASFCGIFGLKPTYGRVPFGRVKENLFSTQHPYQHYGPLTRTVEDAALMLSVMEGYTPQDPFVMPTSSPVNLNKALESKQPLRVAYSPNLGVYEIDTEVNTLIEKAVAQVEQLGCVVKEIELGLGMSRSELNRNFSTLWNVHMASHYHALVPEYGAKMSPGLLKMIEAGQKVSLMEYKQIEWVRTQLWDRIQDVFEEYDLLVSPTLAVPAFAHTLAGPREINGHKVNPHVDWMLTPLFNLTGHPAASVPVGWTQDQLPVGLQVVAPRFEEEKILRLAYMYEQAHSWNARQPNL
ncbi:Asp-tRNA(Asn)/Glu-tRNA(Gln) amidotransferase A subunit family amidase [Caldalkalibacillus uzonensis]|uniref:Asp-tRNA(Asn)/Glu-tRNA(Gln) amidotransferase A subunit family amidase n=1 Tax=Caldalkalibacillus uzonensis TaxID=353224 RepID=A0ABU0CU58_9BACI|nr:amidase [Caldalkalibacillus uzonensis]MDQ0339958.1 Asp-tRNA(Asn)/Glu-tRNA(Gln) amidotransferase A subunit family amidase [Caldalkalibacillus uzonensis]